MVHFDSDKMDHLILENAWENQVVKGGDGLV